MSRKKHRPKVPHWVLPTFIGTTSFLLLCSSVAIELYHSQLFDLIEKHITVTMTRLQHGRDTLASFPIINTPTTPPMPITIGHRGAKGYVPENTRASFEKAIALGVDTVELDVQRCKTGELIVMHDESIDRTTNGQGNVADLTLAKIQTLDAGNGEVVPTLAQSFDTINRRVPVTIELKSPGTAQPTVELVTHYIANKGWHHEDFVIASFDMNELRTVHALNKQILLVALLNELPPDLATFQQEVPATILSISSDKLTPEFITLAHQHGFVVYAWTVNEPQDIARLTQWGIDGIVSDFPDRL